MAIRNGIMAVNPVDRAIEYAPHRKRPKTLVDASEVHAYLEAVKGSPFEPLVLCGLGAGLRPEEARALLWEDVRAFDLKGETYCILTVTKALTNVDGAAVFKDTKNEPSAREAVMGEPFASRMLELAEGREGPLLPSGHPHDPDDESRWYAAPKSISHRWRKWCEKNGVKYVTNENMRSSYSTMMGEAMAPDSVVEGNMGHTGATTKTKHYQRVTIRAKCIAADMLAESLADFL